MGPGPSSIIRKLMTNNNFLEDAVLAFGMHCSTWVSLFIKNMILFSYSTLPLHGSLLKHDFNHHCDKGYPAQENNSPCTCCHKKESRLKCSLTVDACSPSTVNETPLMGWIKENQFKRVRPILKSLNIYAIQSFYPGKRTVQRNH